MDRFFRAVDAAQANAFRVVIVQDFESVAIEHGDDFAGAISSICNCGGKKKGKEYSYVLSIIL